MKSESRSSGPLSKKLHSFPPSRYCFPQPNIPEFSSSGINDRIFKSINYRSWTKMKTRSSWVAWPSQSLIMAAFIINGREHVHTERWNCHWPYAGNDRVKGRMDMVLALMHAVFLLFPSKQPLNGAWGFPKTRTSSQLPDGRDRTIEMDALTPVFFCLAGSCTNMEHAEMHAMLELVNYAFWHGK